MQCFDINAFGDGAVLGCDFVGEVTELGSGVTCLSRGDIVAGLLWGGRNPSKRQRLIREYSLIFLLQVKLPAWAVIANILLPINASPSRCRRASPKRRPALFHWQQQRHGWPSSPKVA